MKSSILIVLFVVFSAYTSTAQTADINTLKLNSNGLYTLKGAVYTGKVFEKHTNGVVGMVGEIKNGMKNGTWMFYYSDGKKKRQTTYVNNSKEGLTYYWYQNGILAKEIRYRDDMNIDQKLWDEKGKPRKVTWDEWK